MDQHRSETEYVLRLLSDSWEIAQVAIDAAERAAKAEFDARAAKHNKKSRTFYVVQLLSHARRYREELPTRVGYGFIVQLYAILESRSRALCREVSKRRGNLPLDLDDIAGGRNMQGVFIFLKKLVGVKIPKEADLNRLRIVRNCIAHANSRLADYNRPEQVTKAIRRRKGISIDSEGYLDATAAFCEECLKAVKSFFDDAFTQLRFGPSANRGPSQQATRHGVGVEQRNGKWVYEIIGQPDVEKLKRTQVE